MTIKKKDKKYSRMLGFTWAYIHAEEKYRSNMKEKRKKYYNDNKDTLLGQNEHYYHDYREIKLKYHALTNHIYIERRRSD
jgi:hypothetical protein